MVVQASCSACDSSGRGSPRESDSSRTIATSVTPTKLTEIQSGNGTPSPRQRSSRRSSAARISSSIAPVRKKPYERFHCRSERYDTFTASSAPSRINAGHGFRQRAIA